MKVCAHVGMCASPLRPCSGGGGAGSLIYQHYSRLEQSASDKSDSGVMDGERDGGGESVKAAFAVHRP